MSQICDLFGLAQNAFFRYNGRCGGYNFVEVHSVVEFDQTCETACAARAGSELDPTPGQREVQQPPEARRPRPSAQTFDVTSTVRGFEASRNATTLKAQPLRHNRTGLNWQPSGYDSRATNCPYTYGLCTDGAMASRLSSPAVASSPSQRVVTYPDAVAGGP
jgi:hypothetical protein